MKTSNLIISILTLWILFFSILLPAQTQELNIPEPVPPPADVSEAFGLDTSFYQQWVDVGGFPVVASAKVNPYAVKEAAYLVYQMIKHRPDILKALVEARARLAVMATTEHLTDIPENRDWPVPYWHTVRGRAIGGSHPVVNEENILNYPGNPYEGFNSLLHEFGHTVEFGLERADPGFDDRLRQVYQVALKQVRKRSAIDTNKAEYWAGGSEAWFYPNGKANDDRYSNTREALKAWDPRLAVLLIEVYGEDAWRYTLPETRLHQPHLQGFDPQNTPTFQYPPDAVALHEELIGNPESTGNGRWINLEPYPPSVLPYLKVLIREGEPTEIIIGNFTGDNVILVYSIEPDGTEHFRHRLRRDMAPFRTHVGELWLIKSETGKDLAVYRAEAKTGRVLILLNTNAGKKIQGPWLWMIAPTQHGLLGSEAAKSGKDYLAIASDGVVTEQEIATTGATTGAKVGNRTWTSGKLAPIGDDNITEMANVLGLTRQDHIDYHVAYGSIVLNAPHEQKTVMYVGSDDAVKVWLNGTLVHNNPIDRGANDYQEDFPVTLKQGKNILLIAVYEGWGGWSGFFGFEKDAEYSLLEQNSDMESDIEVVLPEPADINEDGRINAHDLLLVVAALIADTPTNPRTDVNGDGVVNVADLQVVIENLDDPVSAAAPMSIETATPLDRAKLEAQLNILHAENDGTLKYQRAIAFLQNLLSVSRPGKTKLLANYPNPFNPETWIPYQLSKPAEVRVSIYSTDGKLIRTLVLGHLPAGIYHSRSRAAYWDGRNEAGETVASGVYFYTLEVGDFTATRKMLIRK